MKEAAEAVMTELAVSSSILSRSALSVSPSQAIAMASRAASQPTTIPCTWGEVMFSVSLIIIIIEKGF